MTLEFETLLIPTDGSERAEDAARWGFDLATALEADVAVCSVADSSIATGTGYSGDSQSIRARLRDRATGRATRLRDEADERGLEAEAVVREGIPAIEILDAADELGVDAIVIGTSGRGGVARALIGSVADRVLRRADVPVVTITADAGTHSPAETGFEDLLLPTDGSDAATAAHDAAFSLASRLGATLHALTVVDSRVTATLEAVTDEDPERALRDRADATLESVASDARDRGLEVVTTTETGRPASAICEYASDEGVDLIVMGTAGRGGVERALVGSVADRVVRTAPVPVLTIRPAAGDSG